MPTIELLADIQILTAEIKRLTDRYEPVCYECGEQALSIRCRVRTCNKALCYKHAVEVPYRTRGKGAPGGWVAVYTLYCRECAALKGGRNG